MNNCDFLDIDSGFYPKALDILTKLKRVPLKATFEITARCNFNCKMCYIHLQEHQIKQLGQELSADEWLNIAKHAKKLGLLYITLTGGEIFTKPDFKYLYESLSDMGFLITLMTNASLINDSVIKWLRNRPPYCVRITLYGSNNDTYASVCGIKNGFDKVDYAITLLQESNIPISLKSVIIKNNLSDLKNMYSYAASRHLKLGYTFGIVKPVRGALSDAETVRQNYSDFISDTNSFIPSSVYEMRKGPFRHHPNYLDDCSSWGNSFTVSWDGKMLLCSFLNTPSINLHYTTVEQAWYTLIKFDEILKKPLSCIDCAYESYCRRCPGILAAECGAFDSVTPEFCSRAKTLYFMLNNKEHQ